VQYETKSLYCRVQKEETSNHAAQQYCEINETYIRWLKKQKEQLNTAQTMMLCGKTEWSDDDLGHTGTSDRR
jgi:hypothetical protein